MSSIHLSILRIGPVNVAIQVRMASQSGRTTSKRLSKEVCVQQCFEFYTLGYSDHEQLYGQFLPLDAEGERWPAENQGEMN